MRYIIKQVHGCKGDIRERMSQFQQYKKNYFIYQMPIVKLILDNIENNSIFLVTKEYQAKLSTITQTKRQFKRYEKILLMFRIVRGLRYQEKKNLLHNKLNIDNIYLEEKNKITIPLLGLPYCNQEKMTFFKQKYEFTGNDYTNRTYALGHIFLQVFLGKSILESKIK